MHWTMHSQINLQTTHNYALLPQKYRTSNRQLDKGKGDQGYTPELHSSWHCQFYAVAGESTWHDCHRGRSVDVKAFWSCDLARCNTPEIQGAQMILKKWAYPAIHENTWQYESYSCGALTGLQNPISWQDRVSGDTVTQAVRVLA